MSTPFPESFSIPESERVQARESAYVGCWRSSLIGLPAAKLEIPETLRAVFISVLALLVGGGCFHLIPRRRAVTTKRAAWILGMSRPFVVKLLRTGALPYHRVGNHRRIYLDDILAYLSRQVTERKSKSAQRTILDCVATGSTFL